MFWDTCFTLDFINPSPFNPGRCLPNLSASRFLNRELSDGGLRIESGGLGRGVLADTGDTEGDEPTVADLTEDPTNMVVLLGLFLTQVMLLRFPIVRKVLRERRPRSKAGRHKEA